MYVTRLLSHYQRSPRSLSLPPEGPNSGYLVIEDEESEPRTTCFGLCKSVYVMDLPFTQDKSLTIVKGQEESYNVNFIPVLNQPLSSNRYYAIKYSGSHKGEAYACSREMIPSFCGCSCEEIDPRPLNPNDVYQQFEINRYDADLCGGTPFSAKSVAPDGFLPHSLRGRYWVAYTSRRDIYRLGEAQGINATLRASLPEFNSPIVVGKWYCPFMFVKDGKLKDQVKRSFYYEMTLERRWEKIFACENNCSSQRNSVSVEADVQREVVFLGGRDAVLWDENTKGDGVVLFRSSDGGEQVNVGLSSLIVDRMKWEEERVGWVRERERQVKVNRTEEFGGIGGVWSKFDCYVLVERFVLKRMDRSVVLTYDFKHTHVISSKWE